MKIFETCAIKGEGRGKKIGLPTINLNFKDLKIDYGVYLAEVKIDTEKYSGIVHYGPKKTFSNEISLELFLKNKIKNVFEKKISLKFLKKIRDIIKFSGSGDLKKQIKEDLKNLE